MLYYIVIAWCSGCIHKISLRKTFAAASTRLQVAFLENENVFFSSAFYWLIRTITVFVANKIVPVANDQESNTMMPWRYIRRFIVIIIVVCLPALRTISITIFEQRKSEIGFYRLKAAGMA